MRSVRIRGLLLWTAMLGWWGCDARDQATTQPAPANSVAVAAEWSRDEAAAKLDDASTSIHAAVRLVRLADLVPLCAPDELSDAQMRRLRLVHLGPAGWALGLPEPHDPRSLRAAVLLSAAGEVTALADGVDEELLVLHVSRDAEVFPHVALLPGRVLLIGSEVTPAIVLEPKQHVRFDLRSERGFSFIALLAPIDGEEKEVARYRWDPYEATFTGPARDKLPDLPGGHFEIDLEASTRLEPVGGELPEPEDIEPAPRPQERPLSPEEFQAT